jgi:hypothetical protein
MQGACAHPWMLRLGTRFFAPCQDAMSQRRLGWGE